MAGRHCHWRLLETLAGGHARHQKERALLVQRLVPSIPFTWFAGVIWFRTADFDELGIQRVTTATLRTTSPSPYKTATLPAHMSRVPLSHRRSVHPHWPASIEVGHRAPRLSARADASRPPSSSRTPATSSRCPRAGGKPRARDRLALSPCDMRLHTCFAHAFAVALLRSGGASRASRRVNHLTLVSLTAAVL